MSDDGASTQNLPDAESPDARGYLAMPVCDRSRYTRQHNQCLHARWLNYHSGPYGYGIRAKAESVYLPTGIYTHRMLQRALELSVACGWTPLLPAHRTDVREFIHAELERFYKLIDARGLRQADTTEETEHVVEEQAALIEGLAWTWITVTLPWVIAEFTPVSIEQEELYVIGCTCGLPIGAGEPQDHYARGCDGTIWMSRADSILCSRADGENTWHEFKTSSNPHRREWDESWLTNVQFMSGIVGAERRLEAEIPRYYLHGLAKGQRRKQYDAAAGGYEGPKRQESILCYAYRKPADPPTSPHDEWQTRYTWKEYDPITGATKNRRLGKGWEKVPIWRHDFPGRPPEWSVVEYWVEFIGTAELESLVKIVGPYDTRRELVSEFLIEAAAGERDWRRRLWKVHEAREQAVIDLQAKGIGPERITVELLDIQPNVRRAILESFPHNWEGCRSYFGEDCEYLQGVCLKEPGWDNPIATGRYIHRRPHHELEVEQMVARGIPVPEEEDALDYQEE